MERHDYPKEIITEIDKVLEDPPPSIEDSLIQAVVAHRMTPEEANECLEAYNRTFHKHL